MNCALADPTNIAHDYNVLAIDRSPVINTSYQFYIGDRVHGNRALEGVANGWTIAGITLLQSGPDLASTYETNFGLALANTAKTGPYSIPVDNKTWIGTPDVSLQPALLCNPTSGLGKHQYINGNCFGMPAYQTNGVYSLPYIHGPAWFSSDLSMYKTFKLSERQNLEFR